MGANVLKESEADGGGSGDYETRRWVSRHRMAVPVGRGLMLEVRRENAVVKIGVFRLRFQKVYEAPVCPLTGLQTQWALGLLLRGLSSL